MISFVQDKVLEKGLVNKSIDMEKILFLCMRDCFVCVIDVHLARYSVVFNLQ